MKFAYALIAVFFLACTPSLRADEKQLQEENKKLSKQIDELKRDLEQAKRGASSSTDAKVTELQRQVDDLRRQLQSAQQPKSDPSAQANTQALQRQIDELKKQVEDAKKPGAPSPRIAELEKQNEDLRKQLVVAQQPKAADPNLGAAQKQSEDLRRQLEETRNANDDLKRQLEDHKKVMTAKAGDQTALLQKQSDDQKRLLEEEKRASAEAQNKMKTQLTELQSKNDELRKNLEDSRRNADRSLNDQLALTQRQNEELNRQLADARRGPAVDNVQPRAPHPDDVRWANAQRRIAELEQRLAATQLDWPAPKVGAAGIVDSSAVTLRRFDPADAPTKMLVQLPVGSKAITADVDGPSHAIELHQVGSAPVAQRLVARLTLKDGVLQLQWGPAAANKENQAVLRRMIVQTFDRLGEAKGELRFRPEPSRSVP